MNRFKKVLRITGFVLMMLIAAAGAGMTGAFLPTHREPYQNKVTQIELVEKRDEVDESTDREEKE